MRLAIRVDASVEIGTGHTMRCLTLADALFKRGAEVFFIVRELPGNLIEFIEEKGFKVFSLPYDKNKVLSLNCLESLNSSYSLLWLKEDLEKEILSVKKYLANIGNLDLIIVDSYALDYVWEGAVKSFAKRIMVIDDLADRKHDCDILLDQNYYENLEERYKDLVHERCNLLLGPKYALLRKEFQEAKKKIKKRDLGINRILVFMGGGDENNETKKVIASLLKSNFSGLVDVVVGGINPHRSEIESYCKKYANYNFYVAVQDMAALMLKADFAICGGGSISWERCFLGLPALVLSLADNQNKIASDLAKQGSVIYIGMAKDINVDAITYNINLVLKNPFVIKKMACSCLELVDGMGAKRVADFICDI